MILEREQELAATEKEMRAFAAEHVAPYAAAIDREEAIPRHVIDAIARAGFFGFGFPAALGGADAEGDGEAAALRQGLLHEALGAASASVQGLVNVNHMAGSPIARWGSRAQKEQWIPRLTRGEALAAIAITEPNVGSDAAAVETTAASDGDGFVISGTKRWITCGQIADVFVVLARSEQGPACFIVPRDAEGLTIEPMRGALGCRGYMLAKLHFDRCRVPTDALLGRPGFGMTHVAATGLDAGRYNLAWGCVGLAQACLDAALDYSRSRQQFGAALSEHQLVQRMIARMTVDVHAARLVCRRAGELRGRKSAESIRETTMAKYLASTVVNRVAYDALQIHGANGCGPDTPIERYFRDARIMEIIEGSSQVLEIAIARFAYQGRA
jgi:glutaryl-CoA dehydrogenase (non-decarboxylating)